MWAASSRGRVRLGVLVAGVSLLVPAPATAARLLRVQVHADGRLVLDTYYSDGGTEDAATVWAYLGRRPLMAAPTGTPLPADPGDPLRATLAGEVRVAVRHVDRVIAQARVPGLTLIRAGDGDDRWFLPPDEVGRTAAAAGLPVRSAWGRAAWAAAAVAGTALGVGGWWLVRRRGRRAARGRAAEPRDAPDTGGDIG